MSAAALLNELHFRNVAIFVNGHDRLRYQGRKESLSDELIAELRIHKSTIIAILRTSGSTTKLLRRQCPFCRFMGMRIEENRKSGLLYFDTRCVKCDEIVETCVPSVLTNASPVSTTNEEAEEISVTQGNVTIRQ